MTIGHTDALVMLSHSDAEQLATTLREISNLLAQPGPDRLTDAQVGALSQGRMHHREELMEWCRNVSEYLKAHL
ncbi:hypothetical protein [Saccharothrix sp. ST-888]|uniref:hypothetical protein n=1 Tax=Saccharothrix sp. ST-888 TaxID=1427391 RepID=UPI00069908D6|nr:hypothetical protein [Saccharothrix sp. ST-888]